MANRFQNTFRALKSPNYRIFITGQAISRIGTWMERTAVSWVVYEMTNSTFMLGLTAFVSQFPSFLFSLYGGVLSDKYSRLKIVMITQIASFLQAAILAYIVLRGDMEIGHILTLITLLGIINAFDIPARQSLVHQLIDTPEDLPNAVALNSSVVNLARLAGPALSGIVLSSFGAGICFSINALSYLAVIVSLLFLRPKSQPKKVKKQSNLSEIKATIGYLKHHTILAPIVVYIAAISLLVIPYNTLLPEFAKEVFQGNAQTYGFMVSSIGLGALIGTIFLASLPPDATKSRILVINATILGICLIVFSLTRSLPFALFLAIISGFTGLTQSTICLTIVQTESAEERRGQLISLYAMALFGMMPLGSLLVGVISDHFGSAPTLTVQGLVAILIAFSFFSFLKKRKLKSVPKDISME